jgi:hypothetical protein
MTIFMKGISGRTVCLEVVPEDTVKILKILGAVSFGM